MSDTSNVVVISGSSRGLGRALAFAFARSGFRVVVNGRTSATLDATARELAAVAGTDAVTAVKADVATADGAASVVAAALQRFGRLDVLINNAGTLGPTPRPELAALASNDFAEIFAENVLAPHRLTVAALPALRELGGVVINVTSDAGVEGYAGWGGYGASKAALELMTRAWAAEEPRVRFAAVNPGDLQTDMHQAAFPGEDISDRLDPSSVTDAFVHLATARRWTTGLRLDAPDFEASLPAVTS